MPYIKIICIIVSLLLITSCGGTDEEKANKFLEKGRNHLNQGNYSAAKIEFTNALRLDKKSTEALLQLSLLAESEKDWRTFEAKLKQLLKRDPQHIDARLKLSRFYIGSGQIQLAKTHADYLINLAPENTDVSLVAAALNYKLEKPEEARALINSILAKSPNNVDALFLKANDLINEEKFEAALEVIDAGLSAHPDNLAMNMSKMQVLDRLGRWTDTIPVLEHLIELYPDNSAPAITLARGYAKNGDLPKAISTLETVAGKHENAALFIEAIKLIGVTQSTEEAESRLKHYIDSYPKLFDLRFALADIYVQSNRMELALEEYNSILSAAPEEQIELKAIARLARLDFVSGDTKSAWERVKEIQNKSANNAEGLAIKASLLLYEGKSSEAIKVLREALRTHPESSELHVTLAKAHEADKQWELADQSYAAALMHAQNKSAHGIQYAKFLMSRANYDKAERVISPIVQQPSADKEALQIYAQLMLQKQSWKQAILMATRLKSSFGDQPETSFIMGIALQGQNKTTEAVEHFENFYQQNSESIKSAQLLLQAYIRANQRSKAESLIKQLLDKEQHKFEAHMLESSLYAHYKEWPKAIKATESALTVSSEQFTTFMHLANLHAQNGSQRQAAVALEQGLELFPLHPTLGITLAGTYQALEETEKSIEIYQKLLKEHPDLDVAANNLAVLLLQKGDSKNLNKAAKIAERFRQTKNPAFADTLGWIYIQQGNNEEGLALLRRAADKLSDLAEVQYHLGIAFLRNDKKDLAKKALRKAIKRSEENNSEPVWLENAKQELSKL